MMDRILLQRMLSWCSIRHHPPRESENRRWLSWLIVLCTCVPYSQDRIRPSYTSDGTSFDCCNAERWSASLQTNQRCTHWWTTTHVKKFAWGNQKWVDYFWLFFLVSGKTDYNRLEMQKIIDSAWFSIKIDFNRLKSNWWSSIMLEIQPQRLKSNWLSSIVLEIDFNRLKRNWFSSVMLGIIGNRWFCHWLSWILLKIDRNQSIQHWRTSNERQYIGKQHWWIRFSHPCLTPFSTNLKQSYPETNDVSLFNQRSSCTHLCFVDGIARFPYLLLGW